MVNGHLVLVLIAASMMFVPAFGQVPVTNPQGNQTTQGTNQVNNSILVSTDKPSYNQGDTIVVSGHVSSVNSTTVITLRLFNSNQKMISVGQLLPSADGSFTKTLLAVGPLWQPSGTYTVVAQYGLYTQTTSTFYYTGGDGSSAITKAINATYALQSGGQTYVIPYIIKGGTVSNMNILAPQYTLEIALNTNTDGSIAVTLPRNLIDAKTNSGQDSSFVVVVNGEQVTQFTETENQNVRILSIPFHNGDSKIDVTGTQVSVGSTSSSSVPSQTPPVALITTSIDKSAYVLGDTIVISGQVRTVVVGTPLTIQILDPSDNLVQTIQIDVSQDGKYTDTIKATGALWKLNGKYTVIAQYGPPNVIAQTTFDFQSTPVYTNNVFQLQDPTSQQTFNVNYTINGGSVKTMNLNGLNSAISVLINSIRDGTITLQLPRSLIDAKTSTGQDIEFNILIDGAEVKPQSESVNNNYRTITIAFLQGDNKIDIIGTQISGNTQTNTQSNVLTTVTVSADKQSYIYGDTLKISGMTSSVASDTPMIIRVIDPIGNLVKIDQVNVSQNGVYYDSMIITGELWKSTGTYTIKVQYGLHNITAQTTFNFIPGSTVPSGSSEIDVAVGAGGSAQAACVATNSCFTPNPLNISPGTTVTWKNTDTVSHYVTSGQSSDSRTGTVFDSGNLIKPGQTFQFTFTNPGTYDYFCSVHPWMTGQIIVTSNGSPNTTTITQTQQDVQNINQAKANGTIAAEVNIGNDKTETTSIDNNVSVQTTQSTPDSLGVQVSAPSQTGPKVIAFNLDAKSINVENLKDLGVMYDGKLIQPAPNMDAILHAKPTDNPSFAIVVTQSGVQVLVLVPHFSTHTITITNMTQVIPAVPEFGPIAGLVIIVSMILCLVASKRSL